MTTRAEIREWCDERKTLARQLFTRIVTDSQDKIDRVQAVAMVAGILNTTPLVVSFDIGIYEIYNWHPPKKKEL
jgi:hypothetical protein